jgi:hypothetical protein
MDFNNQFLELIRFNYSLLKNPDFSNKNFINFTNILRKNENIQNITNYFSLINQWYQKDYEPVEKVKINFDDKLVKKILTIYIFHYYPDVMNMDPEMEIVKKLLTISRDLRFLHKQTINYCNKNFKNIDDFKKRIDYKKGFVPVLNNFFNKIKDYEVIFDTWQKLDKDILIYNLAITQLDLETSYNELLRRFQSEKNHYNSGTYEIKQDELLLTKKNLVQETKKLEKKAQSLDKENGITKLKEFFKEVSDIYHNKVKFEEEVKNSINKNIRKAYWDLFCKDIEKGKYERIKEIILDLKNVIKKCVPNSLEIASELDEYLDEEFISQKIKDNVFNNNDLHELTGYIILKLKAFQSVEEDNKTIEFEKELDNIFKIEKDIIIIFRKFMEYIFPRFEDIIRQRNLFFSYFE